MKTQAILAALVLAAPVSALADRKVVVVSRGYGSGYSGGICRVPSYRATYVPRVSYRSTYCPPVSIFRSAPRYYSAVPSVHFSYTSSSSRYSSPRYDYGADSVEVDVQRELRRRGYYRGSLDGDIGPASRAAIRAYQADRGLYASGLIDSTLLRSLGI